jgi:hypothetical protein
VPPVLQETNALRVIFGPAAADLYNPDRVQAAHELTDFSNALSQRKRIVRESDSKCVLEVGEDDWPFPVPIAKKEGQWFFDTEAGKEELLNRRIGRNELDVLRVLRALAEAQRVRQSRRRRSSAGMRSEALRFARSDGGLYWPRELNEGTSPVRPRRFCAGGGYSGTQPRRRGATAVQLLIQASHAPG